MEIGPILAALRRNKIGALLIGLQIALTLAIVCNSLSIIQQHLQRMRRPSGIDETNIFTLANRWVGQPSDLKARIEEDLGALRSLPAVIDAEATNSYPLRGGGWSIVLYRTEDQTRPTAQSTLYLADEHGLAALGLRLVAGRWFMADEIGEIRINDIKSPATIIVTRALANALFPAGNALGQSVYLDKEHSSRIIGIVERAQTPWGSQSWAQPFVENSTFEPFQFVNNGLYYVVRARSGDQAVAMHEVVKKLYDVDRARVIENLKPFAAARAGNYQADRASSVILGVVCSLLLAVTAFGIVGLTMYWVAQRRRQIGMRRAVGATRIDILRYFHTENLLVAGSGALLGIGLGLLGNAWLATTLELTRMSVGFIVLGAAIVLALSQLAVVWPAWRAASISPASAARRL